VSAVPSSAPSRRRVVLLAPVPAPLGERLAAAGLEVVLREVGPGRAEEAAAAAADADGLFSLLVHPVGERLFAAAPRLAVVANCATGVDNVDLAAARRHGVTVANTPGVLTADTADFTWALLLALLRRVVEADAYVRRGEFRGWALDLLLGRSLGSLTLGVVGAGAIGQAVLARARAFGMTTLYTSRRRLPEAREAALGASWRTLDELVAAADVVSLHAPLTPETRGLFDAARLARMRPGAFLVNTARGPLVDEEALAAALASGRLGGAALDVFEREPEVHAGLLGLPNVVLAPHLGSATAETRFRMAELSVAALLAVLVEGRTPDHPVVLPPSGGATPGRAGRT